GVGAGAELLSTLPIMPLLAGTFTAGGFSSSSLRKAAADGCETTTMSCPFNTSDPDLCGSGGGCGWGGVAARSGKFAAVAVPTTSVLMGTGCTATGWAGIGRTGAAWRGTVSVVTVELAFLGEAAGLTRDDGGGMMYDSAILFSFLAATHSKSPHVTA